MGKKTPDAPDYTAAAEQTGESNREALNMQTWANRTDQYNPWGSLTYNNEAMVDPATGQTVTKWTQNQTLTPLAQDALDRQMAIDAKKSDFASKLMDRAGGNLLQDTDWSKFSDFGGTPAAWGSTPVAARPQQGATEMPPQQEPMPQMPQQPMPTAPIDNNFSNPVAIPPPKTNTYNTPTNGANNFAKVKTLDDLLSTLRGRKDGGDTDRGHR